MDGRHNLRLDYCELLQASGEPIPCVVLCFRLLAEFARLGGVTNFTFGMPLVLGNEMELASDRN